VPAADICRHLADFGLTLIVGRIEDDWLLARILGFGVLFGKGTLFGEPRLVKDEVVAAPAAS
jgi:cyclic-di-GMP phosphodiesterase TipF (flagellum assembly factor)